MSKLTCCIPVKPIAPVIIGTMLVLGILVSSICVTPKGDWRGEGFAIYLTKQDIPPAQMEALSHVNLTDQPIISTEDVITYNAQTHEIKLTDEAFERVSELEVPVEGSRLSFALINNLSIGGLSGLRFLPFHLMVLLSGSRTAPKALQS